MLAGYRAAPDGVDAYLVFAAFLALGMAVVFIVHILAESLFDRVGKHQRRAAGGVHLLIVVHLDYLDIEVVAEHLGGLLGKLAYQADAERHIRRKEYGYLLGGVVKQRELSFIQTRGRKDCGLCLLDRKFN